MRILYENFIFFCGVWKFSDNDTLRTRREMGFTFSYK